MANFQNKNPYFSVCIPSYNRAHTLKRCLDSLCKQTYKNFEVLLIDDGSLDNTESIVREYDDKFNIRYIKKKNGGKHTALNVGIKEAADTELFMVLDSDDWLEKDALDSFKTIWEELTVEQRKGLCGIAGKCRDQDGKVLGQPFPESPYVFSYIDMHFRGVNYGDCCECTKTSIIKKYLFPEPQGTKFVPEYYIYDQIGMDYDLYCTNKVILDKEYMEDGITRNIKDYFEKNAIGYLCGLVCRIEKVFPNKKDIPSKAKIVTWFEYWKACHYDNENKGVRAKKIDIYGVLGKLMYWLKLVMVRLSIRETL